MNRRVTVNFIPGINWYTKTIDFFLRGEQKWPNKNFPINQIIHNDTFNFTVPVETFHVSISFSFQRTQVPFMFETFFQYEIKRKNRTD